MSVNYTYVLDWIGQQGMAAPRILDFGCGWGKIVELGLKKNLDIWGADPMEDLHVRLHEKMPGAHIETGKRILKIKDGRLPFPDNHFDIVISNMVFEHVANLDKPLQEIGRVLKPDGIFLALFPTAETWWEGHAKLPFVHWMKPRSRLQLGYLAAMKRLGFGHDNGIADPGAWAQHLARHIEQDCFYRSTRDIGRQWQDIFGGRPEGIESGYMVYRLKTHPRLTFFARLLDNRPGRIVLALACRIRAGRVLAVRNRKDSQRHKHAA